MREYINMDIKKSNEIPRAVDSLVSKVLAGDVNPLEVYVTIKKVEEALKQAKNKLQDLSIDEANKYGSKTFAYLDTDITVKNGPTRYDYSNIPEVVAKEQELKALKDKHKSAIKHSIVDTNTGELLQAPIVKGGRETISVKLKNK
mgnify:FL=1